MYKTDDDMLARATIETWVIKAEKGEQNCCPKCDGKVFEAEKMVTASVIIYSLTNFCAILYLQLCSQSRTPQDMDGTLTLIFAKLETT